MINKQEIIDLFEKQWPRIDQADINLIIKETGGISAFECILMYLLVLDRAPRYVVEFSPNHGYSTQAIAMALRVLGAKKRFATFEINKNAVTAALKRFEKNNLSNYIEVIIGNAIEKVPQWITRTHAKVDFCFIDSDHGEPFAKQYIQNIFPVLQNNCLIGVHDICSQAKSETGRIAFKTSLKGGYNQGGEEKPVHTYIKDRNYCVLHSITGGNHEAAKLSINLPFYEQIKNITGIDFTKLKGACPKTIFFERIPTKTPIVTSPPKDQHVFIIGMNDSGTTFLQNMLSLCQNCVSFQHPKKRPHGLEGQAVAWWKQKNKAWYPRDVDHGVVKLFSEKKEVWQNPKQFDWGQIIKTWNEAWSQNLHYNKAKPRIFLEKTPSSLFSIDMYLQHFPDAKFLIIHRNPYVVAEGIKRTVKKHKRQDYNWTQCANHWVECTRQQIKNIQGLVPNQAISFKYEEMVTKAHSVQVKIQNFIPALHDIDFKSNKVICHSMDPVAARPVVNYNNRHLNNIDQQGFVEMNKVFEMNKDLLNFFQYAIRTKAP